MGFGYPHVSGLQLEFTMEWHYTCKPSRCLVNLVCHNEIPQTGGLNHRNAFSHSSEACKFKIKMWRVFSLCPHVVFPLCMHIPCVSSFSYQDTSPIGFRSHHDELI